jgi:hypothetical protein
MRSPRRRLSRRELGLVAAALLIPLPLFAATGFSAPLPNAIERAFGGRVVIDGQDKQTGSSTTVAAAESGTAVKRSAKGSLALTRGAGRSGRALSPSSVPSLVTSSTNRNHTGGDAETQTQHESSPDQNGGGTGASEQPAEPGDARPADDSAADNRAAHRTAPSAHVGVTGQGAGAGVSVGPSGVRVDAGADSQGGAVSDGVGDAEGTVTHSDGSSTGVGVTVPGRGVRIP